MRSPLVEALLNPLNLVMPALAVAAGLCSAWWLLPLGLLAWLLMVWTIANDPVRRFNYQAQQRARLLSALFQKQFSKVVRAQMRLRNTLQAASGPMRRALAPMHTEVEAVTEAVYNLCQRMTAAENFVKVSQSSLADLENERALLVLALEGLNDPVLKREKQESLQALDSRVQKLKGLATMLERVDAQVLSVVNVLDSAYADIIRLQTLGAAQAVQQLPAVVQQIRQQREQLAGFEADAARVM